MTGMSGQALASRYPALMHPPLRGRLPALGAVAAVLGTFLFGLVTLDISPARLASGVVALGRFLALMVPPDPLGPGHIHVQPHPHLGSPLVIFPAHPGSYFVMRIA